MPLFTVPIPELHQTVLRPVVLEVTRQVHAIVKMKDTEIWYPDEEGKMPTASGTLDNNNNGYLKTKMKRHNFIQVEESPSVEDVSLGYTYNSQYPPVFYDRLLGVRIVPVYSKHRVRITMNYHFPSKTEADRWLSDMTTMFARMRDMNTHQASYHYNLDSRVTELLRTIYNLRESQAGYGDTFQQYINNHTDGRLTQLGDLVGDKMVLGVSERQVEIYGQYGFSGLPTRPARNEDGMFVSSFDYEFTYTKPLSFSVKYPLIVHNKTLPLELVEFGVHNLRDLDKAPTSSTVSLSALRSFRTDEILASIKPVDGQLILPRFDDFIGDNYLSGSAGVIQMLSAITPTDKKTLANFQDLDDVVLDQDLLAFLKAEEYLYLNKPYASLFHVSVYQNYSLQHFDRYHVTSDLKVVSEDNLDLRKQYRVRLSVLTDIDLLQDAAISRLRQNGRLLYKVVAAINQSFRNNPEMAKLGQRKHYSALEFNAIYRALLGRSSIPGISSPGLGTGGMLRRMGISDQILQEVLQGARVQKRTLILGTLAHATSDTEARLITGNNIRVQTPLPTAP